MDVEGQSADCPSGVELLFREPPFWETFPESRQASRHGGRNEQRWPRTFTVLTDYLDCPGLQQVCCLERVCVQQGTSTVEWACAITSLSPAQVNPERLLALWRGHWAFLPASSMPGYY